MPKGLDELPPGLADIDLSKLKFPRKQLAPTPPRWTLLKERGHALLGVVGAGVHRHDGLRQTVGPMLVEFDLGVERFLT